MNSKREIRGTRGKWRIVTLPTCMSVSRLHGRICRKNATGYNAEMEKAFVGMLKSVNGGLGKYPEEKGGFVRRPL